MARLMTEQDDMTERRCAACGGRMADHGLGLVCPRCLIGAGLGETTQQSLGDAGPGQIVDGRYKVLEQIGEGGFGIVYSAEQLHPVRRRVALKIIKPGMDSRQVVARFEAERQSLAMMDHPNIAKVHDAGSTEFGRPYFVMELVRGLPITEFCDGENLGTVERLELFTGVCNAVQHAHEKGIIHRDLKPSNVMVALHDDKPVVKVIDFGVAKATQQDLSGSTVFTRLDQVIGTPAYMSPEQAQVGGIEIDPRSDIYSLGVLLYELLTGRTPFDQNELRQAGMDEIRRVIREDEPPKPSTRLSSFGDAELSELAKHRKAEPRKLLALVRGELDWIVMKALEKNRQRRYGTAAAFAKDIGRYLRHEPVRAAAPTAAYVLGKFLRRNRTVVRATVAIATVLLVGAVLNTRQANRVTDAESGLSQAVEEKEEALAAEAAQLERAQIVEGTAWLERAELVVSKGDRFGAAMLAARAIGYRGFGRDSVPDPEAFCEEYPEYLDPERSPDLFARAESEIRAYLGDTGLPLWSSCVGVHHSDEVWCVAFSPDGSHIVSGSNDYTLRLWDARSGESIGGPLRGHSARVACVAFSPDGARIVSGSGDGTLRLWDALTGEPIADPLTGHLGGVLCVAFSPDGSKIVSGSADNTLRRWDASTGAPIGEPLSGHTGTVNSVAFSPDASLIVSAGEDKTLRRWDAREGASIGEPLTGHSGAIWCVTISPDGARILSGGADKSLRLWDSRTGEAVGRPLAGHTHWIISAAFSGDGSRIVSGARDRSIRLWNAHTGEPIAHPLCRHKNTVTSVAYNADGSRLVSGSVDRTLRQWDTTTERIIGRALSGHADVVRCVSFSPDGSRIVSGSMDESIRLWDVASGEPIGPPLAEFPGAINGAAFSRDGSRIISVGEYQTIRRCDSRTGEPIAQARIGQTNDVRGVTLSPDDSIILSWGGDHPLRLWDAHSGEAIGTIPTGHSEAISCASFSRDSSRIVVGSRDGTLSVWDARTREPIGEPLVGHRGEILCVAFSPDGSRIVSGSSDKTLWQWDAGSGKPIDQPLAGHTDSIISVAYNRDGTRIVSGSRDKLIRRWDAITGGAIGLPLAGHAAAVTSVAFSPDASRIASASDDRTVRLWDLPPDRSIDLTAYLTSGYVRVEERGAVRLPSSSESNLGGGHDLPILNAPERSVSSASLPSLDERLQLLVTAGNWPQLFRRLGDSDGEITPQLHLQIMVSLLATTAADLRNPGASRVHVLIPEITRLLTDGLAGSDDLFLPLLGLAVSVAQVDDQELRERYWPKILELLDRSGKAELLATAGAHLGTGADDESEEQIQWRRVTSEQLLLRAQEMAPGRFGAPGGSQGHPGGE
jgi:WD40 repeat protein/tRNA A-37 threonylcarbamoyl transferase component Bud32